ncbi:MAG: pentapeptide repeat-containing protein [Rhodospirillaceae bacterium]|nr:pentapeptide repeat-containing protein [Rhodospirillales bacterium]
MRHPTQISSTDVVWPKIRVLVFSLDDSFRFLARQTFRKQNVRDVLSTSVSADGTPMMAQCPDIALVDVDGEADGKAALAFLERVRAKSPEMPVLMVARSDDRRLVAHALPFGIEGIVTKPTSGHELIHRVAETLKTPTRMPVPVVAVKPVITLDQRSATPVAVPPPTTVALGVPEPAAEAAAVKAQLAALTARIGHVAAGGGGGGGGVSGGGGWGAGHVVSGKITGGKLAMGDVPPVKASGGSLGADDLAPVKPAAGTLGDDDLPKPPKKTKRELLAEALPEALRPKRKAEDEAARKKAEEDRTRWQEELTQAGHEERTGKDVAGLDVDSIVAAHVLWLTSQGAQGKRATLQGMDLAGGDLARTVLANATFREADLSDCALTEARLDGADFRFASLNAADLSGANLGVAQLRHANLRLAKLEGASLRGADLSGAQLTGAKLAGADFKGATLMGTDLKDTDLSQVDNLSQGQIDKAECDMKTKLPPGIFRPRKEED